MVRTAPDGEPFGYGTTPSQAGWSQNSVDAVLPIAMQLELWAHGAVR